MGNASRYLSAHYQQIRLAKFVTNQTMVSTKLDHIE